MEEKMKKKYEKPLTESVKMAEAAPLASSTGDAPSVEEKGDGTPGIDFGGKTPEEGGDAGDAAAKGYSGLWDE